MNDQIHKFEKAGLGQAPYRFLGVTQKLGPIRYEKNGITYEVGSPGQPMGVCDFCGTGIADCYELQSADGKRFVVGCDCIKKAGDEGLTKIANRENRKKQLAREQGRIDAAFTRLDSEPALAAKLAAIPSGRSNLLDYINFCRKNAGHTGKLRVARLIERHAG